MKKKQKLHFIQEIAKKLSEERKEGEEVDDESANNIFN